MANIKAIQAIEILDSRGIPTVETTVWLDDQLSVSSSVPSVLITDKYEAFILKDGDPDRVSGNGASKAVNNINQIIAPKVVGLDPTKQRDLDQLLANLDGTQDKSKLGSNTILSVSQAVLKAGAASVNMPLYYYIQQKYQLTPGLFIPNCIYSMINGGEYGSGNLDIQEYQVIPASHIDYKTSLFMVATLQKKIAEILSSSETAPSTGVMGGFTPEFKNNVDPFDLIIQATKNTPFTIARDLFLSIDAGASNFYQAGGYDIKDKPQPHTPKELIKFYKNVRDIYKVVYIEDPFAVEDFNSWKELTRDIGQITRIAGDSLTATNKDRVEKAIKEKLCNTLVIKPSQVGTISETVEIIKMAKDHKLQIVIAHRGGETNDTFVADLAVGVGAEFAKFGPPNRGERVAKYNRLTEIFGEISQI